MFGWAAVVNVPDKLEADTDPLTVKLFSPLKFVIFAFVALIVFDAIVPVTLRLFNPVIFAA